MLYGSVCSGIEVASVAWEPLKWTPAFFAEVDPFCRALLKWHWPKTPNVGDIAYALAIRFRKAGVMPKTRHVEPSLLSVTG